jgi:endonuclease YncB( thermonuclease family)
MKRAFGYNALYFAVCLIIVLLILALHTFAPTVPPENIPILCTKVIDGDTIEIRWKGWRERVQLLGIDAPERTRSNPKDLAKYGRAIMEAEGHVKARLFLKDLVEGKMIRLRYSRSSPRRDSTAGRRILAYISADGADGVIDVNAEICRKGYTYWFSRYPHDRREEFGRHVEKAKKEKRGLWGLVQ